MLTHRRVGRTAVQTSSADQCVARSIDCGSSRLSRTSRGAESSTRWRSSAWSSQARLNCTSGEAPAPAPISTGSPSARGPRSTALARPESRTTSSTPCGRMSTHCTRNAKPWTRSSCSAARQLASPGPLWQYPSAIRNAMSCEASARVAACGLIQLTQHRAASRHAIGGRAKGWLRAIGTS